MRRFVLVIAVVGCGGDGNQVPAAANPLGSNDDLLPYPSSLYERADPASPTGFDLDVPVGAFPANINTGAAFDPTVLAPRHGWPATTALLWATPKGVDSTKLVGQHAIGDSLGADSTTVVLDVTTGERIAHFAEIDANELDHLDRQALIIRPAQRLPSGHRIAVAIRNTLTGADGSKLPITPGFQAVLDDHSIGHALLDADRPRLRQAIAALEIAGIPRGELVVAWDFTVADDATEITDPLAARDAALAAMGPLGANLTYTVTSDMGTINGDPRIARRIELDFQAPEIAPVGLTGYHRDGNGSVIAQGMMIAHAYIMVPPCATAGTPAGLLIYGHGFFGSLQELRDTEWIRDISQDGCWVVAGTLWVGLSQDDIPNALLALNDLNKGKGFGEGTFQGVTNTIALAQLLRGKLATEVLVDGSAASIVDPTREAFLGVSMGAIMGSTFIAYDPFITRGALVVGAANWSLMFERSKNWSVYGVPLKSSYRSALDSEIMEQVLEMGLEQVDGATVATATIPNTPTKQLVLLTSMGDTQVPNLAAFFQARSLGLSLIMPAVNVPYGFETQVASSDRAFVIADEHPTPLPPDTNEVFAFSNVAHENVRRRVLLQQMLRAFWATGTVTNTCTGPCDCAAGNCGALVTAMYGGS